VESIDNLIYTLEVLSSALSARDKDKALEAITLLLQQFTMTFGHATRVFLAILFLETLKVHILCDEFEEASSGALALLARLRAVNAAIKQSAAQSAPTNLDLWADDVLDDVMNAETTPGSPLPVVRGAERKAETASTGALKPTSGNPFAAYPHFKFLPPRPESRLLAFVGGFPSDPLTTKRGLGGEAAGSAAKPEADPAEPSTEYPLADYALMKLAEPSKQGQGMIFAGGFPCSQFEK
jgi:hypothetical protein